MTGLNKFDAKERRRQRRVFQCNHIAHDLHSSKYRQRTIERKRVESENSDGSYYFREPYWDEIEND